jgi:hypothetical protein
MLSLIAGFALPMQVAAVWSIVLYMEGVPVAMEGESLEKVKLGGKGLNVKVNDLRNLSMLLGMEGASVKKVRLGGKTLKVNDLRNLNLRKNGYVFLFLPLVFVLLPGA